MANYNEERRNGLKFFEDLLWHGADFLCESTGNTEISFRVEYYDPEDGKDLVLGNYTLLRNDAVFGNHVKKGTWWIVDPKKGLLGTVTSGDLKDLKKDLPLQMIGF